MTKCHHADRDKETRRRGGSESRVQLRFRCDSRDLPGARSVARPGFSAVELVIVLLILGILAAAAAPKFAEAWNRFRVDSAARRIVADLATAQARARAASTSVSIGFTLPPQGNGYQIAGMLDPDRPSDNYAVQLGDPPYQVALSEVSLGGRTTLTYNGYGVPDSGGTIVIASGRYSKSVVVDANTGIAAIQ